eukprot:TRINITY_DN5040_c0_g2_i4.p1 TRINITY_DN5040_c0_g2~~TRINITY_DN5040_c0_g2_i4.p1  ORF type:complete len:153 (+),score=2.16 TRINITY_DN5040_c0_g2_i4:238-696(+)
MESFMLEIQFQIILIYWERFQIVLERNILYYCSCVSLSLLISPKSFCSMQFLCLLFPIKSLLIAEKSFFLFFLIMLRQLEQNLFLIEFSVLPGNSFDINVHCLPYFLIKSKIISSSALVQSPFLIYGFTTFCHLSRHYFPLLPGIPLSLIHI